MKYTTVCCKKQRVAGFERQQLIGNHYDIGCMIDEDDLSAHDGVEVRNEVDKVPYHDDDTERESTFEHTCKRVKDVMEGLFFHHFYGLRNKSFL